jgi:pilus assembly protein CpaE
METFVACNDPSLSSAICAGLLKLGIECPVSHVLSQDSAQAITATQSSRPLFVVFFGSRQFPPEEMSALKQFCAACPDRVKVVAVSTVSSPTIILQAIRCGALDYLDLNGNLETDLRTLLERVKAAKGDSAPTGRLFSVLGPVGGAGASLLAVNIAAALAQLERTCALLDLQLRGGDLATLLKSTPRHTLLSLASKANQLDRAIFDQALIKHESGIHLVASPEPFTDYRQISPQVIQKVVQFARSSYPNVVVDLEDAEHAEQVRTMAASDRIIIPLRLDFVSLYRAKKCIDHLLQSKIDREHIILVANRSGRAKELPLNRVVEVLGLPVEHRIPDDASTVNTSYNLGVPVVIASPRAQVSVSIVRLAKSLVAPAPSAENSKRSALGSLLPNTAARLFGLFESPQSNSIPTTR